MKKVIFSVLLLLLFVVGCTTKQSVQQPPQNAEPPAEPPAVATENQNGKYKPDSNTLVTEQSWITWLANHWNADAETWVDAANSNCNGDVEAWLQESARYSERSKCWNHISATYTIDPIAISTEYISLDDEPVRNELAKSFSTRLMDELCKSDESRSFQITEYIVSQIVTENIFRDESSENIWVCYFWADFKFDGVILPIGYGNNGEFIGAEPCGVYEMILEDGNCTFYPVYSDNYQRVT